MLLCYSFLFSAHLVLPVYTEHVMSFGSLTWPRCGFGLLMYGFGSKKSLIEDFASTSLTAFGVLVINGYLQPINLKQVYLCHARAFLQ